MVKKEAKKKLKGIGGWLLAYVILLGYSIIITPISLVINYYSIIANFKFLYILTVLVSLLLSISVFILIFTKKKWIPIYIITIIWFNFALSLGNITNLNISSNVVISNFIIIIATIITLTINIAWTIYFRRSERVKNTFVK